VPKLNSAVLDFRPAPADWDPRWCWDGRRRANRRAGLEIQPPLDALDGGGGCKPKDA